MNSIANVLEIVRRKYPEVGDICAASRADKQLATQIVMLLKRHVDEYTEIEIDEHDEFEVTYCH